MRDDHPADQLLEPLRPHFNVLPPRGPALPIVVHVPHSAVALPAALMGEFLLERAELAEELRRMTDLHTDRLASSVGLNGATQLINGWSRLVADPERFLDPSQEPMEAVGMGAVYTRTSDGRPLRRLRPGQREALIDGHLRLYHATFSAIVEESLTHHGRCVIVDLHSYPSEPLPYELHGEMPRPAVDIGTDPQHTPTWLRDLAASVVNDAGFDHDFDTPFAGSFVPASHLGDQRVASVMLEIRRDLYLDEATTRRHAGETHVHGMVTDLVAGIAAELRAGTDPGTDLDTSRRIGDAAGRTAGPPGPDHQRVIRPARPEEASGADEAATPPRP